jgi:hypothetical protein
MAYRPFTAWAIAGWNEQSCHESAVMNWERFRVGPMSGLRLRTKLLLLALTTLALPWAGCQYAREMESVLRERCQC